MPALQMLLHSRHSDPTSPIVLPPNPSPIAAGIGRRRRREEEEEEEDDEDEEEIGV